MFELRPYQSEAIETADRRIEQGHRPIICAPCGSGKTVLAAKMAKTAIDAGKRVLWMTGREEIIRQAYRTFSDVCGVKRVGVLCAGMANEAPWWFYPDVTVASWDTIKSRWDRSESWKIPADLVMYDEAHLSLSPKMCRTIVPYYRERTNVGFTATPARKSGKGLGSHFTRIIQVRKVQDIIDDGYLAPCEYWAGSHADVSGIGHDYRAGDFKAKELAAAHRDGVLIGDIVDNWLRIASDRHTIVFAVDIAHAQALTERYQASGISAEVIHSKLAHGTRERISEQFRRGDFQVLVNVGIATYGYDVPEVNCVVIGRPTKSIVLWHQMVGRGMRPKADGGHCMVLDHGDNVRRLGCIEDEIRWRLDEGREAACNTTREGDESRDKRPETPPTQCEQCSYLFAQSRVCPKCGWEKPVAAREVETIDADLVRIRKAKEDGKKEEFPEELEFYRMLLGHARRYGYKDGFAAYKFQEKHGRMPPKDWVFKGPLEPTSRVRNFIRSRQIAWQKRQQKKERASG